jgi:predicted SAM-dependent methyltransferase
MHEMTQECLESIRANMQDYEVVLVDNGSDPPIDMDSVGRRENTIVIRNETNLGFPVAVNEGIRASKGDFIILLNNDTIVTPFWSSRLIDRLVNYSFDIVGPVTNYAAGMQRVTIPVYNNLEELNQCAEEWSLNHAGIVQEVNWVIGFCLAFRRSLYDEFGPFDESLWPCSGEELDFCLKARKAGKKVGIAKDVYIHHYGTQTFKVMEDAGILNYEDTCDRNNDHLESKFGKNWFVQSISGQAADFMPEPGLRLNLGSGYSHAPGYVNIDNRPETKPDLVCDILNGLPYEDNTVDEVRAYDFLEHIPVGKTVRVVNEIWRVLKPGGKFISYTPDAEHGQGAFQDPTHVSFWVESSWLYYSDPGCRALYDMKANFKILPIVREETPVRAFHLLVVAEAIKEG